MDLTTRIIINISKVYETEPCIELGGPNVNKKVNGILNTCF